MVPANRSNVAMTPWMAPSNRMEGLFDRLWDRSVAGFGVPANESVVPISLWHDHDHIYVEADLPGMTAQDVEVSVHQGVLFIRGERKPEQERQYLFDGRTRSGTARPPGILPTSESRSPTRWRSNVGIRSARPSASAMR